MYRPTAVSLIQTFFNLIYAIEKWIDFQVIFETIFREFLIEIIYKDTFYAWSSWSLNADIGQLNSEWIYEGRNPWNFWLAFWEKQ